LCADLHVQNVFIRALTDTEKDACVTSYIGGVSAGTCCRAITWAVKLRTGTLGNAVVIYQLGPCTAEHAG